jgi:carbon monoxide dehydrogenase subunit G
MRWFLIAPVVLLVLGAVMAGIGLFRPRTHVARARTRLAAAPDAVWNVISDFERWPEWQPGMKRVERLPAGNGPTTLITEGSWGEMPMRIEAFEPATRLVTFLDGGVFTGRWTWQLEAAPEGGTVVTLTEEGEVGNPFFRTMMIFNDNYKTMLGVLGAMGTRLGEAVTPERLPE